MRQMFLYEGKAVGTFNDTAKQAFARALYACGIPFNVLRNPFMHEALQSIAQAGYHNGGTFAPPSYEEVRGPLLEAEVKLVDEDLSRLLEKDRATYGIVITADGWTNVQSRPIINVMSVCMGRAKFETAIDCTGHIKTGEFIAEVVGKVIEGLGAERVVGVVMDGAKNCGTAMRLLKERWPHLCTSVCTAHVIDLAFEDIGKIDWVKSLVRQGQEVVNYVTLHERPLSVFRKYSTLALQKHVPTRFGTNYIELKRLIAVLPALRQSVYDTSWAEYAKSGSGRYAAAEANVRGTILSEEWERDVKAFLKVLEPLFALLMKVDGNVPIVGKVYYGWFNTIQVVKELFLDGLLPFEVREQIEAVLRKRWDDAIKPVHGCGYVLEPEHRTDDWWSIEEVRVHFQNVVRDMFGQPFLTECEKELAIYKRISDPIIIQNAKDKHACEWWEWDAPKVGLVHLRKAGMKISSQVIFPCFFSL